MYLFLGRRRVTGYWAHWCNLRFTAVCLLQCLKPGRAATSVNITDQKPEKETFSPGFESNTAKQQEGTLKPRLMTWSQLAGWRSRCQRRLFRISIFFFFFARVNGVIEPFLKSELTSLWHYGSCWLRRRSQNCHVLYSSSNFSAHFL